MANKCLVEHNFDVVRCLPADFAKPAAALFAIFNFLNYFTIKLVEFYPITPYKSNALKNHKKQRHQRLKISCLCAFVAKFSSKRASKNLRA
ncbi:MAG: hypothetical protein WC770_06985 [Phycisphaerae bacterium]|jgi:hypothetical protein